MAVTWMQIVTARMSGVDRLKLGMWSWQNPLQSLCPRSGNSGSKARKKEVGAGAGVIVAEEGRYWGAIGDTGEEGLGQHPLTPPPLGLEANVPGFLLQDTFLNGSVFLLSRKGLTGELPGDR